MNLLKQYTWWCPTCKAFMIFSTDTSNVDNDDSVSSCNTCNTKFIPYDFRSIDKDVINEQRVKFIKQRDFIIRLNDRIQYAVHQFRMLKEKDRTDDKIDEFNKFVDSIKEQRPSVIETDAGVNRIEDKINIRITLKNFYKIDKFEHDAMFKGINRNDRCWCGSGKKHKHCCLNNLV